MNKLDWSLLTSDEKFSILVGIFGSWATVMVAFLDKVVHSISAGNVPFDESPPAKPQP